MKIVYTLILLFLSVIAWATNGYNATLSANGNSAEFQVSGPLHVHISGTFGSGTMTLQFQGPDNLWHNFADSAFTTATDKYYAFPERAITNVRWVLTGATAPSIYYWFQGGGS